MFSVNVLGCYASDTAEKNTKSIRGKKSINNVIYRYGIMSMMWLNNKLWHLRPFNQTQVGRMVSEIVTTNALPDPD